MKRTEIFELVRIGIDAVIEANWADRKLVPQPRAYGVTHIVEANILRARKEITRIGEYRALQFSENRESIFGIKDSIEFSTDRMTVIIVRAKIAFAETAHGCRAANEKTFVDRNSSRFAGTAGRERMNNAYTSAERDRGLPEPALKWRARGFVYH